MTSHRFIDAANERAATCVSVRSKLNQKALVERSKTYLEEVLSGYLFKSIEGEQHSPTTGSSNKASCGLRIPSGRVRPSMRAISLASFAQRSCLSRSGAVRS